MALASQNTQRMGLSRGQIISAVAAAVLLIGFFLPWVNAGAYPSGMALATTSDALSALGGGTVPFAFALYLVPALAIVALVLSFVRTRIAGPMIAGAALVAFAIVVLTLANIVRQPVLVQVATDGGTPLPYFGAGVWVSIVAALALSVSGVFIARQYLTVGQTLTTRRIVTAGMLGAIAITLGVTRLGFIPVPNSTGNATIMHIPAIIGAVLEGPVVGIIAGGIFGLFSWLNDTTGVFSNPIISVLPRLLIGLMAWLAYRSLAGFNRDVAAAVAGVVGTLTNTVLVVGLLVIYGILPLAVVPTIIPQAIMEVVAAAVLTPLVTRSLSITRSGRTTADETGPRDKSYF